MGLRNLLNPYAYIMRARRAMYHAGLWKSEGVSVPVISVGNLTLGGTGKTPLTMKIARHLATSKHVAIVLRGYKRKSKGCLVVSKGHGPVTTIDQSGDEAMLYATSLDEVIVVVDEDRIRGAKKAVELGGEVVLLDDGFQHMRIRRDLNILIVDAGESLGTVIPLGNSREPMSASRDADIVVFTNATESKKGGKLAKKLLKYVKPDAVVASLIAQPSELELIAGTPLPDFSENQTPDTGHRFLAVSSIANPRRFHIALSELGAQVMIHALPDHAEYSEHTVRRAFEEAVRMKCDAIVITTKDAVKSRDLFAQASLNIPVYVLHIELEFLQNEEGFFAAIDRVAG
jgi:tetraacyldisaccharide 4'-kinase